MIYWYHKWGDEHEIQNKTGDNFFDYHFAAGAFVAGRIYYDRGGYGPYG